MEKTRITNKVGTMKKYLVAQEVRIT